MTSNLWRDGASDKLPDQPNIVLIMTDQERYPMHWPEGLGPQSICRSDSAWPIPVSPLPRGIRRPICAPRVGLPSLPDSIRLGTGCLKPSRIGGATWIESGEFSPDYPNLATLLKSAGYQIAYKGKWHLTRPVRGNYDWSADDNRFIAEKFGFDGWECPDAGGTREIADSGGSDENPMWDETYTQQAERFIANVDPSRPFCLVVSLVNPHDVLLHPNNYDVLGPRERFANLGIGLPRNHKQRTDNLPKAVQSNIERATKFLGPLDTEQLQIDNCKLVRLALHPDRCLYRPDYRFIGEPGHR